MTYNLTDFKEFVREWSFEGRSYQNNWKVNSFIERFVNELSEFPPKKELFLAYASQIEADRMRDAFKTVFGCLHLKFKEEQATKQRLAKLDLVKQKLSEWVEKLEK